MEKLFLIGSDEDNHSGVVTLVPNEEIWQACGAPNFGAPSHREQWEALQTRFTEQALFAWLTRKYVQESDERQHALGLQYTTAETHDLAAELAAYIQGAISP